MAVPRLVTPPMHTERMSTKCKSKKTKAPRTTVRFKFGPDVRPHMVAEFKRTSGLPQIAELHPTPGLIAARVSAFVICCPALKMTMMPSLSMKT